MTRARFTVAGGGPVDLYTELCGRVPVFTIASS